MPGPRTSLAERDDARRSPVALTVADDPLAKARELRRLHTAWSSSRTIPPQVRDVVARAWRRQEGMRTTFGDTRPAEPVEHDDVVRRREENSALRATVATLERTLLDLAAEASNELVVCDADGVVLWLSGPGPVRRSSERLGFVEGATWTELAVGTNALGTALTDGAPCQIFGPEHSRQDQHSWVCTGSPIRSPRSGRVIGAVTLSGPLHSAHPHTLALVTNAVRTAEDQLEREHREELDRLAARAPATGSGERLVLDPSGWVASSTGLAASGRLWIPSGLHEGVVWVPALGHFHATSTPGGWLLRPASGEVSLSVEPGPPAHLAVSGPAGRERIPLTARHLEIVRALAAYPQGLSARDLATVVYGSGGSTVAVRSEVSRLRRRLGGLIETRPYRLTVPCRVTA
jgi:hypothetical protein